MNAEPDLVALLLLLAHVVLGGIAIVLVSANRRPSAAIAWVLTIIFIPVVGVVAFLLVGLTRLPKSRREKQRYVSTMMVERTDGLSDVSHAPTGRTGWRPWWR